MSRIAQGEWKPNFKDKMSAAEFKRAIGAAKKSKYNSSMKTYNGKKYHSAMEANYAAELDMQVRAGVIRSWTGQHRIEFKVNDLKITNYYMDFRVVTQSGGIEYHEVKGCETDVWRIKWRLLKATFFEQEGGNLNAIVLIKRNAAGWAIKREMERQL